MRKYSEKYSNNYKILSKAIVGFEFEAYYNISYYKTLENLNAELSPVKVHGFRTYHSDFIPDNNNFKLERDLSGGVNLAEIVTGPMDYYSAKFYLIKILKFIQEYGYTNDRCSLHINISFKDKSLSDLNILREILRMDEDELYKVFPTRKNNIYAKSVRSIIPFKDYDFSNVPINIVKNNISFPSNKYYGINFLHINEYGSSRLEFRYIGGEDYEQQLGDIIDIMDRFIINTYDNIGSEFDNDDIKELSDFMDEKINVFKSFETYDDFLVEFPDITLQIDQDGRYEVVSGLYDKLHSKIYKLIESCDDMGECIFNYFTSENKFEVVGANFTSILDINGYDFIDCEVMDGIFNNCNFVNSKVLNSEIMKGKIGNSDIIDSKLFNCNVDEGTLERCYFESGLLNAHMEGGIFRSGKIGAKATISSTTKIVDVTKDNFFNTKADVDDKKNKKI